MMLADELPFQCSRTSTPPSIIHHPDHHFTSFISPYHHNFTSSSYRLHIKSKMTRSHKANDRDHKGIAEGTALPTETVPRFFGKNGFADVDPKKVKKDGSGRGNWGTVNDDIADEQFTFTNTRRRSNSSSFSHHVSDLKTKFEVNEPEPVFEESLHGPEEEDQEDLSKTDSSESGRSSS
ncbi:hypothetical protein BFJ70_g11206 [Fusarium oxysporum]|nr:hypothetical protein BFJ70_g11206 [Fusarium oxysporum]